MAAGVDFHCHLDLYPDFETVAAESERNQIYTLSVTTTPRAWPRNRKIFDGLRFVKPALGIHPELIQDSRSELELWRQFLPSARYIGEVGLDRRPKNRKSFDAQLFVFRQILQECRRAGDRILTLHSAQATSEVLALLSSELPVTRGKAVLHWFTGTSSDAETARGIGVYLSVNAEMLSNARVRKILEIYPLELLLTETDGPFTFTADRARRPSDVRWVVEELARVREVSFQHMHDLILRNLRVLVS